MLRRIPKASTFSVVTFLLVSAIMPVFLGGSYWLHILVLCFIFATLVTAYDFLWVGGVLNFGIGAAYGLGAYVSALFSMKANIPVYASFLIGGIFAALFGSFISLPTLRLEGISYICIVTIGGASILQTIFSNWIDLTRGYLGLWGIPTLPSIKIPNVINIDFRSIIPNYYVAVILFAITLFSVQKILKSRMGLYLRVMREDKIVAASLGVDTTRYKVLAFTIHSFLIGLAGAFYAHYIQVLTPDVFSISITLQLLTYSLVGGGGTIYGPILAAFVLTFFTEALRFLGGLRLVVFGLILLFTIIFAPGGLHAALISLKNRLVVQEKRAR